jgi:hypothetical protein
LYQKPQGEAEDKGGPHGEKIIAQLLQHSVVNDISCKPEGADVWQRVYNIKTLNASFYH